MELLTGITIKKATYSRVAEVDFDKLGFGKHTADHMFMANYADEEWQQPAITPYADLLLSPSALALHYGQTVFEGMKAFRMNDGRINIFRLDRHYDRFVRSLERMCMAVPSKEMFTEALQELIMIDKAWVPAKAGDALYIRPFIFASEAKFGVKVADEYQFIIFTGPVPALYAKPIKVKVETTFIRAAKGGTGFAKCGGNYGAAFYPTQEARKQGYDQVLWTTGGDDPLIEESGMMNAFFVIDDRLVTAPLSDTILDGITRDSLLTIARDSGIQVEEKAVSINELKDAFNTNRISEAFGAGTAAVVAPIGTININEIDYHLPPYGQHSIQNRLKEKLEAIRTGIADDKYNWNCIV